MKTGFYGWKLLFVFWLILAVNLAFPFYGASVINTYMAEDFKLDRQLLGLIFTIFMLTSGVSSPLAAMVINRIGVRYTMVIGSILVLVSALCMALLVNSGLQAVVFFGVISGLGVVAGGALPAQTGVNFWFDKRRALALSIVLSAPGFGGFFAAPILNRIIAQADGDWRVGWWLIAGLSLISIIVAALFIRENPAAMGQYPDGLSLDEQQQAATEAIAADRLKVYRTREEWRFAEAIKTPVLWLVMFCTMSYGSTFAVFLAHGVIHLQDLGHSPAAAARALSAMTISTLVGNFIAGALADRIEPRYLLVTMLCCSFLAMLLLPGVTGAFEMYPATILLGIGFGGSVVCVMTLLSNYFGLKVYAYVAGCTMAAQIIGSSTMPVLAGTVYDHYGSYANVFHSLAGFCVCGAVLLLFVRAPLRPQVSELQV